MFQVGQRIVMFSYGSGMTSTMFSFKINEGQHPFSLSNIANILDISNKLESRHVVSLSWTAPEYLTHCKPQACFVSLFIFHAGSTEEIRRGAEADGAPLRRQGLRHQPGHGLARCRHLLPHPCRLHVPTVLRRERRRNSGNQWPLTDLIALA